MVTIIIIIIIIIMMIFMMMMKTMMIKTMLMLMQMMMAMILIIMMMILSVNNTENGRKEKDLWSGHFLGSVLNGFIYIYTKYRDIYYLIFRTRFNSLSLTHERLKTSGIIIEHLVPVTLTCSFLLKSMP